MIIASCLSKEPLCLVSCQKDIYSPMFSSKSLKVLAFICSIYMIHLKLIFMYGVRYRLSFPSMHADIQLFRHHRKKKFFPFSIGSLLCQNQMSILGLIYFQAVHPVPLVSMLILKLAPHSLDCYSSVISFEVWSCDCFNFVTFFKKIDLAILDLHISM